MIRKLTATLLLMVLARPAASYFNLFLSQTEVRRLMGKNLFANLCGTYKVTERKDARSGDARGGRERRLWYARADVCVRVVARPAVRLFIPLASFKCTDAPNSNARHY